MTAVQLLTRSWTSGRVQVSLVYFKWHFILAHCQEHYARWFVTGKWPSSSKTAPHFAWFSHNLFKIESCYFQIWFIITVTILKFIHLTIYDVITKFAPCCLALLLGLPTFLLGRKHQTWQTKSQTQSTSNNFEFLKLLKIEFWNVFQVACMGKCSVNGKVDLFQ